MIAARDEIAPDLFGVIVRSLGLGPSRPVRVMGRVSLSDHEFGRELVFRDVEFASDLMVDAASFTGLGFVNCTFLGRLRMRNCQVSGDLYLHGCSFPGGAAEAERLAFRGTHVKGNFEIDALDVHGTCSLAGMEVDGELLIVNLVVASGAERSLTLDNARIQGGIALMPAGRARQAFGADAAARSRTHLSGGLSAYGVECHSLRIEAVDIDGDCRLTGLQARGGVAFVDSTIGNGLIMLHLDCEEVLAIRNNCSIAGDSDFSSARVGSQINLSGSHFGRIVFNGSKIGSFWVGAQGAVWCRQIFATDSDFSSYVRMSRLTVSEAPPPVLGATPAAPGRTDAAASAASVGDPGVILFRHCRFGSQFVTWAHDRDGDIDGWQVDNQVVAERSFLFTDCTVGGELNLTRLKVGGGDPAVAGDARLDRSTIGGALHIASPLTAAQRLDLPAEARTKARTLIETDQHRLPIHRATMRSLSMRDLSASSVELSGLTLLACGDDPDGEVDGSLIGDRMKVKGDFSTYVCDREAAAGGGEDDGAVCAYCDIPGALRLRGAVIGELHLAGDPFRRRDDCSAWNCGVVLELADIGQLRVPRYKRDPDEPANGFPVPLDLSGMIVRNWSFERDLDDKREILADDFLDFLDNDQKLHREVYKSIAQSLRNVGRDREAERILFTEEYRARWEQRARLGQRGSDARPPRWPLRHGRREGPLARRFLAGLWAFVKRPTLIETFEREFLQYRRNTINLLYLIVFLFGLSAVFVSSQPGNFELSDRSRLILQNEARAIAEATPETGAPAAAEKAVEPGGFAAGIDYRISGRNVGPDARHWGIWNALWMAARYHVPIVSLAVQDEYVASNDNRLQLGLPWQSRRWRPAGEDPGSVWFTAEDWFAIMSIFNWIMWPLLLTFALRRALRAD